MGFNGMLLFSYDLTFFLDELFFMWMSASGMTLGLWSDVLDRFGPPILSSVIIPLAAWSGQAIESVSVTEIVFRLGLWLFASLSSLLFFFAQQELSRFEAR